LYHLLIDSLALFSVLCVAGRGNAIRGAQGSTNVSATATSSGPAAKADESSIESRQKATGAAAAAARKRAGKKASAGDKDKADK